MQEVIERLVNVERFDMGALCEAAWPLVEAHPQTRAQQQVLKDKLGDHYKGLCSVILRNVFLIELVKVPTIESTKVRVRWHEQLAGDSRECSFDECLAIAAQLLTDLNTWLQDARHEELIRLVFDESILAYDAPLDYRERPVPADAVTRIHRMGNISWFYDDLMLRTVELENCSYAPQRPAPMPSFSDGFSTTKSRLRLI